MTRKESMAFLSHHRHTQNNTSLFVTNPSVLVLQLCVGKIVLIYLEVFMSHVLVGIINLQVAQLWVQTLKNTRPLRVIIWLPFKTL